MRRLISALAVGIVAAVVMMTSGSPVRSGDKDEPPKQFAGKFLSILRKSGPDSSTNLEKVHVLKLEERSFLVGMGADTPDNWQKGRSVWVSLDDIGEMTLFDSLEELKKALDSEPKAAPPAKTSIEPQPIITRR